MCAKIVVGRSCTVKTTKKEPPRCRARTHARTVRIVVSAPAPRLTALARLARWFGLSWRGEVPDDVVARGDSVIGSNWEGGPLSGSGLGVPALARHS